MAEKHKIIITAAAVILVLLTLFVPPFFGKGDDGSFYSVLLGNGLYNPEGANTEFFNKTYGVLPDFDGGTFLPLMAAKAVSSVFNKEWFDIRFMAIIYLPAYILGLYLIISSLEIANKKAQIGICIFSAIILCDIGYISYFNSFYTDAMYLSAFGLLFGSLMYISFKGRISVPCMVFILIAASLVSTRGAFGTTAAIFTGALVLVMGFEDKSKLKRPFAIATALIIAAISLSIFSLVPTDRSSDTDKYNAIFGGVLTDSENAEEDLAYFGIPAKYAALKGKTYYEADEIFDFAKSDASDEMFSKITKTKTALFYITHPSRLYKVFDSAVKNAPFLTQSYIKIKTDDSYGIKKAPAVWSWAHRFMTPGSFIILLVFYIAVLVVSIRDLKKNPYMAGTAVFMVLLSCVLLAEPVISGGLASISRRLVLYQFSLDMLIIICVVWAVNTYIERRDNLKKTYGVNQ